MAYTAGRRRPEAANPNDGSRTMTITGAPPGESASEPSGSDNPVGTLRLRGGPRKPRNHVVWSDDVVDNEGCGKKSSKICCIYHKPKKFDESSDEDTSSDEDSDSSCGHSHRHRHCSSDRSSENMRDPSDGSQQELESEPNAYEYVPPSKGKGKAA